MEFESRSKLTMSPWNKIRIYSAAGVHSDLRSNIWKANTMIDMRDTQWSGWEIIISIHFAIFLFEFAPLVKRTFRGFVPTDDPHHTLRRNINPERSFFIEKYILPPNINLTNLANFWSEKNFFYCPWGGKIWINQFMVIYYNNSSDLFNKIGQKVP